MKITVEISMYPLRNNYIPPIDAVIDKLNSYEGIEVTTVATATLLIGDYDPVMDAIKETVRWSHQHFGIAVFVSKLIPGYVPNK